MTTETTTGEMTMTTETTNETTKPKAKKVTKVAKKTETFKKAEPSHDRTSLKAICGKLRMDPRTARRVLRAEGYNWHEHRDRWNMTPKQMTKVTEVLKAHQGG